MSQPKLAIRVRNALRRGKLLREVAEEYGVSISYVKLVSAKMHKPPPVKCAKHYKYDCVECSARAALTAAKITELDQFDKANHGRDLLTET